MITPHTLQLPKLETWDIFVTHTHPNTAFPVTHRFQMAPRCRQSKSRIPLSDQQSQRGD